ncbi:oligosaccharide flippase family protein [Nakamurella deserti]|uniref:oligosaccharide flippase family protein n=1 Tax=Nakamurella deserti TaxID=2164074 RepID=UPI00147861BB|nr:oligosaccharide flippase family protein [Nakamurella deserti]
MASGIATTVAGNAVAPAVALVTMPILAYVLGVEGRGQLAAATAPLILAATASTFGVPEAVTHLIARAPSTMSRVTRLGTLLIASCGLVVTATCIAMAGVLAGSHTGVRPMIVAAILALVPTLMVLVLRGCAAGLQRWRLVALEQAGAALLRLAGVTVLAVTGALTPFTATMVIALAPVVAGLAYLPLLGHARRAPAAGPPGPAVARSLAGFGSRVWIGSLSGVLLARLDQVLMTPLSDARQLGLYAVVVGIADVTLIIHMAVRDVTFAADSAAADDRRLCAAARITSLCSLLLACAIAAALPLGLPLLFGAGFAAALPAGLVLLAAVVAAAPGSIAGAGLSARGRPGLRSLSLAVAVVVNVVLLVLLVPAHGALGAAVATLAGNLTASALSVWWMSRCGGVPVTSFLGIRRSDLLLLADRARTLAGAVLVGARMRLSFSR